MFLYAHKMIINAIAMDADWAQADTLGHSSAFDDAAFRDGGQRFTTCWAKPTAPPLIYSLIPGKLSTCLKMVEKKKKNALCFYVKYSHGRHGRRLAQGGQALLDI